MWKLKVAAVLVLTAGTARAHDRWEYDVFNASDDGITTPTFMRHGARQIQHDLQANGSTIDADWYAVKGEPFHSYEARVNGGLMGWVSGCTAPCPGMDLLTDTGLVVKSATVSDDDVGFVSGPQTVGLGLTVRWSGPGTRFLRATGAEFGGPLGYEPSYDISLRDTTFSIPRWNNSGTQVSIFVIQNTTPYAIAAQLILFDAAGSVVHTINFILGPRVVQVQSTAGIAALAGKSGSGLIITNGGYGALAGKVVSVEASTGFTFDTPIETIPY